MTSRFHAWGDESIRLADSHPVYLLAATISELGECESIRASLRAVPFTGTKLHWRDLDDGRRRSAAELVAGLDLLHVVVVGEMVPTASQERMRALCLERLAWELDDEGVGGLTLETRPPSLMRRDMRTIDALRGKRALPPCDPPPGSSGSSRDSGCSRMRESRVPPDGGDPGFYFSAPNGSEQYTPRDLNPEPTD